MALVTTTEMKKKAYDGGYAIGAFNERDYIDVEVVGELNSYTPLSEHCFLSVSGHRIERLLQLKGVLLRLPFVLLRHR